MERQALRRLSSRCGSLLAFPGTLAAILFALCAADAAWAGADDVFGEWRTPDAMNVQILMCDHSACGRIVRMSDPSIPDMYNPEPRLRTRPVLGIQILYGMRRSGAEGWKGQIYRYASGYSYPVRLSSIDRAKLKVEVCGPFGLFCKQEIWTRSR